jgi:hypothetical protein
MKTSSKRKATATKATVKATRNAKKTAKGKVVDHPTRIGKPFTSRAVELRGELHRFDELGQEHNRYALVAMILCERQSQFEWEHWAGQRGSGIDSKRAMEVSNFLEQNGFRKYDRSYVGKIWSAMLKTSYVTNASTARKNGEALEIDADGLRVAVQHGAVKIDIAKDQNKKTLKQLAKAREGNSGKKKTVPTLPDMVTTQKAYRDAIKHLNSKIAKLEAKAKLEGWKA